MANGQSEMNVRSAFELVSNLFFYTITLLFVLISLLLILLAFYKLYVPF